MSEKELPDFKFRPNDNLGDPDAAQDKSYLADCFVDPGALEVLRDCEATPRIILGRTGSGKTALLYKISQVEEHVTEFNPEKLSLNYISNSTILPFLFDLGLNLDLFFDLLWRHMFATELIKKRYDIHDTRQQQNALNALLGRFERDETKRKALDYLRRWGDKFWLDADERAKQLTERLEKAIELTGNVSGHPLSISSLRAAMSKSTEAKSEIVQRCQYVLNSVQANDLAGIVELVAACLDDEQQKYFVLVDGLDDDWVDNAYKTALIRGLVRSVRAFTKVRSAKVIVALRYDLLARIFTDDNLTAQREKFENLFYELHWSRGSLVAAIDERSNKLVMSRYSRSKKVTHKEIMVGSIGKRGRGPSALDYMIDRTLMRPRDLISFFNICIKEAGAVPIITADTIRGAEREYSRQRLAALEWEWKMHFPNLITTARAVLAGRLAFFSVVDIYEEQCIDIAQKILAESERTDVLSEAAEHYDKDGDYLAFKRRVVWILYEVGIIGLKMSKSMPTEYVMDGATRVSEHEIAEETRIAIHKCFWRALGTREVEV